MVIPARFLQRTHRFILRHDMICPGETVLVGVSGGADSLALLHALYELRQPLDCQLHVVHLDHGLRPDSASDAEFVRQHADRLNLPITTDRVDIATLSQQQKLSVETAARKARYKFYESVSKQSNATKVALGHHCGDQAETILMNLLRGAGAAGLKGILPVRDGKFIRPLLNFSRGEIEEFVAELGLKPREDSTNFDRDYLRNRIRLELLPLLKRDYNPNLQNTLAQTAELLRAESDYLDDVVCEAFDTCQVKPASDAAIVLNRPLFLRHHLALRRRILRLALGKIQGEMTEISFNHVESMLKLTESQSPNGLVNLPNNLEFRRAYDQLIIQRAVRKIVEFEQEVSVPGNTHLPVLNSEVVATIVEASIDKITEFPDGKFQAVFDLDQIQLPLTIRSRRPGDRFQPFGMEGTKKVKDFLIDAKVPGYARQHTPILTNQSGILWVVGHRTSEKCKVSEQTKRYVYLTYSSES